MEPYQRRVVDEKAALDLKIAKLDAFMVGDEWHALSQTQQQLLNRQRAAMMTNAGAPTRKDGAHGVRASCPSTPAPIPAPHDTLTLHAMLEALKCRAVRDRHFAAWFEAGEWIAYLSREASRYPAKWRGFLQRTKR